MEILVSIFSVSTLLATLRYTTPLLFTSLGGLFSERSGVVNIGLEGMIIFGAAGAAISAQQIEAALGNPTGAWWIPWMGLLVGALVGGLVALIHAVVSIKYRGDQIISGTAINIAAAGAPSLVLQVLYNNTTASQEIQNRLPIVQIGSGQLSILVFFAFALVPVVWWALFRTPWGLRLRAVGEHPEAAETMGVNVIRMRYTAVILSGVLAGIAGAYLSIGDLNQFVRQMSAGRGFIALAALIFGKWNPVGVLGSTLLFGFFQAIAIKFQSLNIMPSVIIEAIPYVLTMLVLAGFIGRSRPPAAVGKPYDK